MKRHISMVAIVVADYDEAIRFYTEKLGFELLEDTKLSDVKRWVRVAPKGSQCEILLAKGANNVQREHIGDQTGGRVGFFMCTDDINRDYRNLLDNKVVIVRKPVVETWGTVLVSKDLYGNMWDLIEPRT